MNREHGTERKGAKYAGQCILLSLKQYCYSIIYDIDMKTEAQ